MGRLAGKTAFVAGGTGGIGSAIVRMFAREGAKVAIGSRGTESGEALAREVRAEGGAAAHIVTDVNDEVSVERAVAQAVDYLGRLDILVSNAGGSSNADGPVTEAPLEEFWRTVRSNQFGAFLCARFAVPHIIAAGGGSVINMASVAGFGVSTGRDAYTSAKGGVIALTKSMARTWVTDRVRVNAIAPAAVGSDRIRGMLAESEAARAAFAPQKLGLIEPEEIAAATTFLASDEARSLTGQIIAIHGGSFES